MKKQPITQISSNDQIIQVKLGNVEKNPVFVSHIFKVISMNHVNIDMISQVMLDDEMRIDFTCSKAQQKDLNKAIEEIRKDHPRIQVYQIQSVCKIMVAGELMENETGVAAKIFEIFGQLQVPVLQVTTSDTTISYVIEKVHQDRVVQMVKQTYHIGEVL